MRSFENVDVLREFIEFLFYIYVAIIVRIIVVIIIISIVSYIIYLIANTKFNIKIWKESKCIKRILRYVKELFNKENIKLIFEKDNLKDTFKNRYLRVKPYLWKCRYLIIWLILFLLSWAFVSFLYWIITMIANKQYFLLNRWCTGIEGELLWMGSIYTLILFVIASIFITFSFWNKFVRNIWIFIYILWISLIFLWLFLTLWCPAI